MWRVALSGVNSALSGVNSALPGVNSALSGVNSALPGVNSALSGVNSGSIKCEQWLYQVWRVALSIHIIAPEL